MALTLFQDTYCTLAEAEARLASSKRWEALATDEKKENFLKQATLSIDESGYTWDGEPSSSNLGLAFPRDFGAASDDELFGEAAQRTRLRSAVIAQVEALLSYRIMGKANANAIGAGGEFTYPERHAALHPDACSYVERYAAR